MNGQDKHPAGRQELKERIIEEAGRLFASLGIRSVTMDEIATTFGISKRTLYEMFSDKENLLIECIRHDLQLEKAYMRRQFFATANVMEVLLKRYQRSIERFHATSKKFFEDIQKYPRACEYMKNGNNRMMEEAVSFFKEGVRQGYFREDINFAIAGQLVRAQMDVLMESDLCKTYPFLEVYESIMFTFLRGISTPKGATELENFILTYRQHTAPPQQP